MAQAHTPLTTALVGISASGAGALIAWAVGNWHGGIPDAAAGFLGALVLTGIHVGLVKIGAEDADDLTAGNGSAAAGAPAAPAAPQAAPPAHTGGGAQ